MAKSILMLCPTFYPILGGVELYTKELCEFLRDRGHSVCVFSCTFFGKGPFIEKQNGLTIYRFPILPKKLTDENSSAPLPYFLLVAPLFLMFSLISILRNNKFDLIHAHSTTAGLVGLPISRLLRKPLVISTHGNYFPVILSNSKYTPYRSFIKLVLNSADRILAHGNRSKKELLMLGINENRIRVWIPHVDVERLVPLDKNATRKELGLSGFVALFVGRLVREKGTEQIIELAEKMKDDSSTKILVIGDGPLKEKIQAASKQTPNLIYLGKVSDKLLHQYYNASDVVLVPTQVEGEGLCRVAMEALSCGVPVIASNLGALPETINGDVGILIDPTVENIKEKVEYLEKHRSVLNSLQRNCRAYATNKFSMKNMLTVEKNYQF